jgi:subtilisin family serine protease
MKRHLTIIAAFSVLGLGLSAWAAKPTVAARYTLPYDISLIAQSLAEGASEAVPAAAPTDVRIPYWVDLVNAENTPDGGEGVCVAVLDTGLLPQWTNYFPEAQILTGFGKGFTHDIWWDSNVNDLVAGPLREDRGFLTDAYAGSGHGTHVASTVIGFNFKTATADFKVRGVAPKAVILPVLVLDAWEINSPTGMVQLTGGFDDMIAGGIRYVADLAATLNMKTIVNLSLGGPEPSPEIREAIDYAIENGVIVVASAGNAGTAGMGWPGAFPEVISSAAGGWSQQWIPLPPPAPSRWWLNDVTEKYNTADLLKNNWQLYLTDFSSRPNKYIGQSWKELDVCAPGAAVVGPFKDYFSTTVGYYYLYGTSMAAPHVSGVAAIIAQNFPELGQFEMESALKTAAIHLTMPSDGAWIVDPVLASGVLHMKWRDHEYGSGFLTVDRALQAASAQ